MTAKGWKGKVYLYQIPSRVSHSLTLNLPNYAMLLSSLVGCLDNQHHVLTKLILSLRNGELHIVCGFQQLLVTFIESPSLPVCAFRVLVLRGTILKKLHSTMCYYLPGE